jgi:hypothetical protein
LSHQAVNDGDDPAAVAKVIAAAATDRKPKLRYTREVATAQHHAALRPRPGIRQIAAQILQIDHLTSGCSENPA